MVVLSKKLYFKLFTGIFLTVSILFVALAETVWFPIKFHHTDNFIAYIVNRKRPFDSFNLAFYLIYIYYLLVFGFMTIIHVVLYRFIWGKKRNSTNLPIKWIIYLSGMFITGFVLALMNKLYRESIYKNFFEWIWDKVFLDYLDLIITEYNVVLLYIIVCLFFSIVIHHKHKKNYADNCL